VGPIQLDIPILEGGTLAVEPHDGVSDSALDRLWDASTVALVPVGQHLSRLVGPLKDSGHDLTARLTAGLDVLRRGHQGGSSHLGLVAKPRDHATGPVWVFDRDLAYQLLETVVTVGGRLVEGRLTYKIRHGEQEKL